MGPGLILGPETRSSLEKKSPDSIKILFQDPTRDPNPVPDPKKKSRPDWPRPGPETHPDLYLIREKISVVLYSEPKFEIYFSINLRTLGSVCSKISGNHTNSKFLYLKFLFRLILDPQLSWCFCNNLNIMYTKMLFRKNIFQNFQNFFAHKKFIKIFFKNFFEKTFPKKNISKKKHFFLFVDANIFFFSKLTWTLTPPSNKTSDFFVNFGYFGLR